MPDPRSRRGTRHRLIIVLGVAVCAVLAGATSYTAIAEWAADLTPTVRRCLGLHRRPPCESTLRRVLQRIDAGHLDEVISRWLAARVGDRPLLPVIAIDGKTARGARGPDGRAVHLLAAFDTTTGVVLAHSVVDGKTNEINAFRPLLDRLDIHGALITADALHTQRGHVTYLTGRGAHYLLTVKGNQPTLLRQLTALPWRQVPAADQSHDTGHGRRETRTIKATTVAAGIGFPDAATALQITRRRRPRPAGRWHTEPIYALTDLTVDHTHPAALADAARAHWGIENRLHWIRDVTYAEDLSQIRTGNGPAVMATLRTSPSASTAEPAPPTSSQPPDTSADTPTAPCRCSYNSQINFAEALAIYRLRTGVAWRDLPAEFGPWQTVWNRHYRFCRDGTWDRVLSALQVVADDNDEIDWRVSVDSTVARVHQHGATAGRSQLTQTSHTGGAIE